MRGQDQALGTGWFCILSLYKFAGQAEVQQHRVADMLGGVGRDRPSDTPPPPLKSTFFSSRSFLQNSGLTFLTSLKIKSPIECRTQTTFYYDYMCTSRFFLYLWKSRVTYRLHKGS